ncbi:MAG: hypothetical protein OXE43_09130 [Chloroflexi bacterium]|nr:hypothetical protein [Chloroflexota bacterium]
MALFDTLRAALRLQEAGFHEAKAGAIVTTVAEAVNERLATKDDLQSLEQRLTIRMGMMVTAATGILLAAMGITAGVLASM